jgi:hypothetical protein
MWGGLRGKVTKLLEESEMMRRELEALKWDMEQVQQQIRRAVWRRKGADAAAGSEGGGAGDAASVSSSRTDTAPSAAPSVDPVSAKLLARRGRPRLHPPEEVTQRGDPENES